MVFFIFIHMICIKVGFCHAKNWRVFYTIWGISNVIKCLLGQNLTDAGKENIRWYSRYFNFLAKKPVHSVSHRRLLKEFSSEFCFVSQFLQDVFWQKSWVGILLSEAQMSDFYQFTNIIQTLLHAIPFYGYFNFSHLSFNKLYAFMQYYVCYLYFSYLIHIKYKLHYIMIILMYSEKCTSDKHKIY